MDVTSRDELQGVVIGVVSDITQDWDFDSEVTIGPDTLLIADLAFESINLVQLAVSLEQAVDRRGLPFENLFMEDGDYVDDLSVREVIDFLHGHIGV